MYLTSAFWRGKWPYSLSSLIASDIRGVILYSCSLVIDFLFQKKKVQIFNIVLENFPLELQIFVLERYWINYPSHSNNKKLSLIINCLAIHNWKWKLQFCSIFPIYLKCGIAYLQSTKEQRTMQVCKFNELNIVQMQEYWSTKHMELMSAKFPLNDLWWFSITFIAPGGTIQESKIIFITKTKPLTLWG